MYTLRKLLEELKRITEQDNDFISDEQAGWLQLDVRNELGEAYLGIMKLQNYIDHKTEDWQARQKMDKEFSMCLRSLDDAKKRFRIIADTYFKK